MSLNKAELIARTLGGEVKMLPPSVIGKSIGAFGAVVGGVDLWVGWGADGQVTSGDEGIKLLLLGAGVAAILFAPYAPIFWLSVSLGSGLGSLYIAMTEEQNPN